ncbi:MAG: HAD family phosphatase, partial [Bacteroidales bacterium]|nr:HAD family phosphatase [Bacteroidales bacterium]
EIIQILKKKYHLGPREETLQKVYFQELSKLYETIQLVDGIKTILEVLKKHRFPIALASSSKKSEIYRVLDKFKLTSFFDMIVAGEDVKQAKPSPEIYLAIKKKYPGFECFVVEDSAHGLQAAIDAGMKTIFYNPHHNSVIKNVNYEICSLFEIQNIITEIHFNCFTVSNAPNITLEVIEHKIDLTPSQNKTVEQIWQQESKQQNLFNGQVLCHSSHKQIASKLYIQCFLSGFSIY